MATTSPPEICVLGSLNVDYFCKVEQLAKPGETIAASELEIRFGGKGGNQAIAAARQGAHVAMLGQVGSDEMGESYLRRLSREGLDATAIEQADVATGSAFISVDAKGENTIVVASGANRLVDQAYVETQRERISAADALLVQFEVPSEAIVLALQIAREAGVLTFVNTSPFPKDFPWSRTPIDYLIVNEGEAGKIDEALSGDEQLLAGCLIITSGAAATLAYSEDGDLEIPTLEIDPVDTVGAGDAFAGTLAARIVQGESLGEAILHANIAGGLTTLKLGAQEAIPTKDEVDARS